MIICVLWSNNTYLLIFRYRRTTHDFRPKLRQPTAHPEDGLGTRPFRNIKNAALLAATSWGMLLIILQAEPHVIHYRIQNFTHLINLLFLSLSCHRSHPPRPSNHAQKVIFDLIDADKPRSVAVDIIGTVLCIIITNALRRKKHSVIPCDLTKILGDEWTVVVIPRVASERDHSA